MCASSNDFIAQMKMEREMNRVTSERLERWSSDDLSLKTKWRTCRQREPCLVNKHNGISDVQINDASTTVQGNCFNLHIIDMPLPHCACNNLTCL